MKTFVILLMNNIWLVIWYFEISFCLIFQPQTCVKIRHSSNKEIKMRDNYSVKMNYSMQTFKLRPKHMLSIMLYFRCISIFRWNIIFAYFIWPWCISVSARHHLKHSHYHYTRKYNIRLVWWVKSINK